MIVSQQCKNQIAENALGGTVSSTFVLCLCVYSIEESDLARLNPEDLGTEESEQSSL